MKETVLIFSNSYDQSTVDVTDWIEYLGFNWERINGEDLVNNTNINLKDKEDSRFISLWYRRSFPYEFYEYFQKNVPNTYFHEVANNVFQEYETIYAYLYNSYFSQIEIKLSNSNVKINKLNVLKIAKECNLDVPDSLVTTNKDDLLHFLNKNNRIITKAVSNSFSVNTGNGNITSYTEEVSADFIDTISDVFFPSFFQEYIEKKYELRVFYIDGKCYAMAIFSQNNNKTKLDFRNYDDEKPNRCVPYKLPDFMENRIKILMEKLNLNCGSIDLIKSTKNNYVFLEVNEVGQFGMTSKPCNYYLEKEIAKYLTNYNE